MLGAGGMLMYDARVLAEMSDLRAHGVLFIADEVMTGWGAPARSSPASRPACRPDILCSPKG